MRRVYLDVVVQGENFLLECPAQLCSMSLGHFTSTKLIRPCHIADEQAPRERSMS